MVDMVLPIKGAPVIGSSSRPRPRSSRTWWSITRKRKRPRCSRGPAKLMTRDELLRLGGEMARLKASMARGLVARLAGLVGA